jgi:hypothetical protein
MNVLKENLILLNSFPRTKGVYFSAVENFQKKVDARSTADLFRLSLEVFFKEILQNSKTLENNINLVGQYLKELNLSTEIRNNIRETIKFYTDYQNAYIKHPNIITEFELDWIANQTALFIRTILLKGHTYEADPLYVEKKTVKEIESKIYQFLEKELHAQEFQLEAEEISDYYYNVKIATSIGPGTPRPQFYIYEIKSIDLSEQLASDIRSKVFNLVNESLTTTTHQHPYLIFILICSKELDIDEVKDNTFGQLHFNMELRYVILHHDEISKLIDQLKGIINY